MYLSRILDFISECIDTDDGEIISDIVASDIDEYTEDWLDNDDETLQGITKGHINEKLKDLLKVYQNLEDAPLPSVCRRKRSVSPERRPKNKRNYKFLPTKDDGSVEMPLVLGRGAHRTIVLNLGEVHGGNGRYIRGKFVYPTGFLSKRKYFSYQFQAGNSHRKLVYYCTIKELDGHPLVRNYIVLIFFQSSIP